MAIITTNLFPILCLCFTVVLCDCKIAERKPWVLPTRYMDYDLPYIEFTCSANLQPNEFLNWYSYNEDGKQLKPLTRSTKQKQAEHKLKLHLLWPLALLSSGDNISCSLECLSTTTPDGEPIYSSTWTENITIIFNRTIPPLDENKIEVFADDGNSVTEFTCWANLHQWELLSWYQIKDSKEIILTRTQQVNLYGYLKVKLVKTVEPSDNGTQLYCAKEQMSPNMTIARGVESEKIQIKLKKHFQRLETPRHITVEPKLDNIIGDENEELKFACTGSKPVDGRNITWHIKGPDMKISYPKNVFYDDINRNYPLTLRMAQSYHESQLYCAQDYKMELQVPETDQRNEYHYGMLVMSQPTTLLHRSILKEAAFVTVEPNTSVYFDVNTNLRFTCHGSRPVHGMTYSWFRIDSNSRLSIPEHQKYDPSTITNVLELSLNETFHQNQLYCAQGFTSSIQNKTGELMTSNKITLIRRDKGVAGETNWMILAIALPLTLVAVAVAAAAALRAARRRRAPPAAPAAPATDEDTDVYDYATLSGETAPQVTYAELDLPQCETAARAQEPVLYVEIVGIYRP